MTELDNELKRPVAVLKSTDYSATSVASASELLLRFISLAVFDTPVSKTSLAVMLMRLFIFFCYHPQNQDFRECKKVLLERGEAFLKRVSESRKKIAYASRTFIKDGAVSFILFFFCSVVYSRYICLENSNSFA